jgi:mannose-6-phosphate isomerase-like protein (cupin superfamily)
MATSARIYTLDALLRDQREFGEPWYEFLRVATLRAGVYVLPAGSWDSQTPHDEDEIYYVVAGRGTFEAGDQRSSVEAGAVIFVPARQEHRFADITEELTVLVLFASPRG